MATIKDVANQAGVSIATVSHVVNKNRYVSPEMTAKVEAAMNELQYKPNVTARNFRTQRSNSIAFLFPDFADPDSSLLARYIEKELSQQGYSLIACATDYDNKKQQKHLENLLQNKISGIIINSFDSNKEFYETLQRLPVPVICINGEKSGSNISLIHHDVEAGAYEAVRHLLKCGHEKIVLLTEGKSVLRDRGITRGYRNAIDQYHLHIDQDLIIENVSSALDAQIVTKRQCLSQNSPTALIGGSRDISIGILSALSDCGLCCPKDISVIALATLDWAGIYNPPLASVDFDMEFTAKQASKTLLAKIEGRNPEPEEITIPPHFKVRNSTKVIGRGPFGEMAASPDLLELSEHEIAQIRSGGYTAAISFHYLGSAWSRMHEKGIKDTFDSLEIKVLAVTDAHFEPEMQNKQHDSILSLEPDILISIPTDEILTAKSYKKIIDSGAKLVLINNVPSGLNQSDYVTCVSVNEGENGHLAGRLLGEYLTKTGKTQIALLKHGAPFFATKQRDAIAEQVLGDEFPWLQISAVVEFHNEKNVYGTAQQLLQTHPEIEGMYITWEGPAVILLQALHDLQREDIAVVTSDIDHAVALNMAAGGPVKGLSTQRPYEQGRAIALAAANSLLDKEVPSYIGVPPASVKPRNLLRLWQEILKENPPASIKQALKRSGYLTPADRAALR